MCMKDKNIKRIAKITDAILLYLSKEQLYIKDINEDELLKKKEDERDKELREKVETFLKEFAKNTGFWEVIAQYGMTFAKDKREKPYFFDVCTDEDTQEAFDAWLNDYEARDKVPVQINELLCRPVSKKKTPPGKKNGSVEKTDEAGYWQYWTDYSFPMIILYNNKIPYFIYAKENPIRAEQIDKKSLPTLFNEGKENFSVFEENLNKLHTVFNNESSEFKIFFTSNFRGMHSQTFIKFKKPICKIEKPDELSAFIRLCFLIDTAIGSVIYDFDRIINYHEYYGEILKHGTKAAMTAIMSRNLSHNIGSHVLSYLIQNMNSTTEDYKNLYQYIQHRMDFLAEVTTSGPTWEISTDFDRDILNEFKEQKILLKYICKSEKIELTGDKINNTFEKGCNRVSIPNGMVGRHAFFSILENFIRNEAKHYKSNDEFCIKIELKIPNYLVLSSNPKINNGLEDKCEWITSNNCLRFKTDTDNFKFLTEDEINSMYPDNNSIKNKLIEFVNLQKNFIELRIWDMRTGSCHAKGIDGKKPSIAEKLREYISGEKSSLINPDGSIKPGGWGIKEMLVSAAFLRKLEPDTLLDKDNIKPPLMDVLCGDPNSHDYICKEKSNNCKHVKAYDKMLGYRLYLRRPKEMLVVAENVKISEENIFQIECEKEEDLLEKVNSASGERKLKKEIPHRLLLISKNSKNVYENSTSAPCRIRVAQIDNKTIINDDYYLNEYENFIKQPFGLDSTLPSLCYLGTMNGGGGGFFKNKLGLPIEVPEALRAFFKVNDNKEEWSWPPIVNNLQELKNTIIFYYHAEKNTEQGNLKALLEENIYVQPVSGGFSTKAKLDSLSSLKEEILQKHFILELIESALTKVVVVDERVSEWANHTFNAVSRRKILNKMEIYVLEVDTENVTSKDIVSKFEVLKLEKIDFFVIHQGILDKFDENEPQSSENFMKGYLKEESKEKCIWKVVDSGRGVPHTLPEDVRFIEMSALLKMIMEYDKHALVQTLFSLRRKIQERNHEL